MNLHLAEIATQIAPGAHAALLVDQAGWHLSGSLVVPPNITLIPLPTKCPELNPQQNVWRFMRDMSGRRPLSRVFREGLRTSRVRSCLRPVRADKIAPLALMFRPLWLFATFNWPRLYQRRRAFGLPSLPLLHITSSVTLDPDRPSAKTLCK